MKMITFFGAISNSTSIAGILTLKPELVDMSDGLFELILVKAPRDLIEVADLAHLVTTQNYESSMLTFVNAKEFASMPAVRLPGH